MQRVRALRSVMVALGTLLTVGTISAVSLPAASDAATPAPYDGSQSTQAAPSCWAIKQQNPAAASGIYWLETPELVVPKQFYCDMTTDGGGWVLVGRGRDGWNWSDGGQGSQADVRNTPSGVGAFDPSTVPSSVIDGLMGGTRVDSLTDGVRIVRSTNTSGTQSQDLRVRLSNRSDWSWALGGGELFNHINVGGTDYGSGNTQSWAFANNQQFLRLTTSEAANHNYSKGFAFGTSVSGQNNAASYLWTYSNERSALPFTQVFIRPKVTSTSYSAIPDSGLPAQTLSPLESSTTAPMPWGVSGVVGGGSGEFNIEVQSMAYVGRTMYVGGKFQYVQQGANGQKIQQSYLAGFNVDTGEWLSTFRPVLNGTVWDLQAMPDGNLLVGGEFTSVNGAPNSTALAELDPATGALVPTWKSDVSFSDAAGDPAQVKAIDVQGNYAYVVGRFTKIYNGTTPITVSRSARVSVTDGTPDGAWKPQFDGTIVDVDASAQGDRVYMVGYFSHIDGVSSPNEGAVSTAAGAPFVTGLQPWVPSSGSGSATYQQAIREYGNDVWQGGSEHILSDYDRGTYARKHSVITKAGGDFQAITEVDGVIYAGCHCGNYVYTEDTDYSNPIPSASDVHNVKYIIALDASTGQVIPDFWPSALDTRAGNGAWELQPDPNGCLWFAGDFSRGSWTGSGYQWLGGFGKFCPRDTTAPTVPSDPKTTVTADGVKVSWSASTDNGGTAPSYEVLRNDRVIGVTSGQSFTDTSATLPAKYWVRAIDETGNRSATTASVTASAPDTSAPSVAITAPANGAPVFGPTTVTVDASDDIGVASVTLSVDGTTVGTDSDAPYSFTWNAAAQGQHVLQATAVDASGNTGSSAAITVTVPADTSPPDAPGDLAASNVTATSVDLTWNAAADDRGVAGYQVVRDGTVVGTPSGLAFTDSGLAPGGTYAFTVRAVDGAGNVGADSSPVSVTTPAALFQDSFTGTDGAAWPAAWTTSASNGSATLAGNAGRLQTDDVSGAYARAQLTGVAARGDSDVLLSYQWNSNTAAEYFSVYLRGSGGWQNGYRPRSGYGVQLQSNSGTVVVQKNVAGVTSTLRSVASAQQLTAAKQWLRLRVSGSSIQFKTWLDGQVEPTAWTTAVTDTDVTTAGQLFISTVRAASNSGVKSVTIDDVTIDSGQ